MDLLQDPPQADLFQWTQFTGLLMLTPSRDNFQRPLFKGPPPGESVHVTPTRGHPSGDHGVNPSWGQPRGDLLHGTTSTGPNPGDPSSIPRTADTLHGLPKWTQSKGTLNWTPYIGLLQGARSMGPNTRTLPEPHSTYPYQRRESRDPLQEPLQ